MTPLTLQSSSALGPIYEKPQSRTQYKHQENETCSRTDDVFQEEKIREQKVRFADPRYPVNSGVEGTLTKREITTLYDEMIGEHVERRISFFFQQQIVCYRTGLYFKNEGAQNQGQSTTAIGVLKRHASHSSGLPCLIAYDRKEWERFQQSLCEEPAGHVFLKDSDYYRTQNATMSLPAWVNHTDSKIDRTLRAFGEEIVNQAAKGEITPENGVNAYLEKMLEIVHQCLKDAKDERIVVLEAYKKHLKEIQGNIANDPEFFDRLLDLHINNTAQPELKKEILGLRYLSIRQCHVDQAELMQKVNAVKDEIFEQVKENNNDTQPPYLEPAFKDILIRKAETKADKDRLRKLFNFPQENYRAQLARGEETKYDNTREKLACHGRKILQLTQRILCEMRSLRSKEETRRSRILRSLRVASEMSQAELGQELKARFPDHASSQSTISRIETSWGVFSLERAMQFGSIFGVDPGLFMTRFFYE